MPVKEKEPEKPKDEEKKADVCEEEKPKEEEKADSIPKWAVDLGAKLDKVADALVRLAVKPEEEKPKDEKKADAYPKPEEEEKPKEKVKPEAYPKEEEKQKPEKYPYGSQEEKLKTMVEDAIKAANLPDAVEKAIAKRFTEEPIEKRGRAVEPGKESEVDISSEALSKMSWKEVENLAKKVR